MGYHTKSFLRVLGLSMVSVDLPKNDKGLRPCFISNYHSDDYITYRSVKRVMGLYLKRFFGYTQTLSFSLINTPSKEELEKNFKLYVG